MALHTHVPVLASSHIHLGEACVEGKSVQGAEERLQTAA